jgi:Domain of unknown function (DUF4124)
MASEFDFSAALCRRFAVLVTLSCGSLAAHAAAIYTCTDASGKRLTSDRPIPECNAREQRQLNADGSIKRVVPPTMSMEEQAEFDARERLASQKRLAEMEYVRRDRNLRIRYPSEAAHQKARTAALDDVRRTLQLSQKRLESLELERKPLLDEAEFYKGRAMPSKLKQQLDGIDATAEAQRELMQNQRAETLRIDATFDAELVRLRALWAGAVPGSLGPMLPANLPAAAAPSASAPASGITAAAAQTTAPRKRRN